MVEPILIAIAAAIASVAAMLIFMPKAKGPKPDSTTDLESPTAEAGRPLPVVFGTITVKGVNCLWFGDKQAQKYKTGGGGGK